MQLFFFHFKKFYYFFRTMSFSVTAEGAEVLHVGSISHHLKNRLRMNLRLELS